MTSPIKKLFGWFGAPQAAPANNPLPTGFNSQHSLLHDGSETALRGQLVQVLMRDRVRKSGLPPGWIDCQIQVVNSRTRGQGIYVRLVVKHWDERLMKYAFAFQKTLLTDIVRFEPKAAQWIQGISWQLEVAANCPVTELPGPEFWQAPVAPAGSGKPVHTAARVDPFAIIPLPAHAAPVAAALPAAPAIPAPVVQVAVQPPARPKAAELPMAAALPAAIAGLTATELDDTTQDLERLFAIRDNELANLTANHLLPPGYDRTEASPLQNN